MATVRRTRPKITVTVAPGMLAEVDAYVREHEGTDRSKVIDEALRCWYAQKLHEALVEQYTAPQSPEEQEEHEAWRRIRAAQMPYFLAKYDERNREEP